MKNITLNLLLSVVSLLLVSVANGAAIPAIDVVITNASGKVAHKGTTSADGSFATGKLAPGNYVVQFNSTNAAVKGSKFQIAVAAGKNNFSANAVAGEKLADAGVAMKVVVAPEAKITGQVGKAGAGAPVVPPVAKTRVNAPGNSGPVKIIDGKRYVWVKPEAGSVAGGEWVEESEALKAQQGTVRTNPTRASTGMRGY